MFLRVFIPMNLRLPFLKNWWTSCLFSDFFLWGMVVYLFFVYLSIKVHILEKIYYPSNNPITSTPFRRKREEHLKRQLGTVAPQLHMVGMITLTESFPSGKPVGECVESVWQNQQDISKLWLNIINPRYVMSFSMSSCCSSINCTFHHKNLYMLCTYPPSHFILLTLDLPRIDFRVLFLQFLPTGYSKTVKVWTNGNKEPPVSESHNRQ